MKRHVVQRRRRVPRWRKRRREELVDTRRGHRTVVITSPGFVGRPFGLACISRVARDRLEVELAFDGYDWRHSPLQSGDIVEVTVRRGCVTRTMRGVSQVFRWSPQKECPEIGLLGFWLRILPTAEWRRA